ncbi:MAG: hypothetical protein GQ469_05890 [Methanosarcinales archaeon]|nr:hypothetical protein [Methanosarcinales archaeon]
MRPIKAIILAANKKTGLKIRTESGLITTLPYKRYHTGESILINYDFTKNKVIGILEYKEERMTELKEIQENDTPENLNHEL